MTILKSVDAFESTSTPDVYLMSYTPIIFDVHKLMYKKHNQHL